MTKLKRLKNLLDPPGGRDTQRRSGVCPNVLNVSVLQLILAVQDVDRIMGQLMDGLKQIGFHRCLNIIVLADHGELPSPRWTDVHAGQRTDVHPAQS